MEPIKLEFEFEESPASDTAIALYISVCFHGVTMKHILDVEEFFNSLEQPGFNPLFTCSCGNFGCGGYYIEVIHKNTGLILKNSYNPLEAPGQSSMIERFEFMFSWQDVIFMGKQIQGILLEISQKWPGYSIYSGTYCCLNLAERLPVYEEVLARLEMKL